MTTETKERPPKGAQADGVAMVVADRAEMLRAAQVASVVETKNTIPILANMVIEASGDELAMTATDLDIAVRVVVAGRCEGAAFATTVAAKRFAALVGGADEGCQISLSLAAGGRDAEMKAARGRYKLPILPREDFPLVAFVGGDLSFSIDAKRLAAALVRTSGAECNEHARYYLCGTLLAVVDGRLLAVATNGHIMAEVDLAEAPDDWPMCILPAKLTALLARVLKDAEGDVDVTLDKNGSRIRFEWGAWSITSKLIDGTFPDWRRVIPPVNSDGRVVVDSAALGRAIARVSQMSGEKTRAVLLTVGEDVVTIGCTSPENGEAEEEVAASGGVVGFRMKANATYLRDIAAAASGDSVAFDFGEENSAVRVEPQAGGGFVGVLMPIRI